MTSRATPSEAQTQKAILDWLAAKHILAFRMQVAGVKVENRFFRAGVPGMADILAFPHQILAFHKGVNYYEVIVERINPTWIEVKAANGSQSALQKSFQAQVEAEGHRYILARDLDAVIAALGY